MKVQITTQLFAELFMTGSCMLGRLTQIIWNRRHNKQHKKCVYFSYSTSKYMKNAFNFTDGFCIIQMNKYSITDAKEVEVTTSSCYK